MDPSHVNAAAGISLANVYGIMVISSFKNTSISIGLVI